ncbi:MAG: YdcF family protein, partial [Clostridia bacterium]|nr:YdcF family protein [Clostridia bacterium]
GIYILNLYIGPLISLGVINAGNLFGFCISGILIGAGIFWTPLLEFLKKLWQSTGGKAVVSVFCALVIAFCAVFLVTLSQIVRHSEYTADNQSTVIVLGCQMRGSEPSITLRARCRVAAEYMKEHPEAVTIATGGQGADEDLSEGQCIFNLMTENGVDADRIYIEDKSTNTDQNIANAKKIIDENCFSSDVAVATSEYHQYRASMICKKNGLTASSIPSPSSKRAKPTFFTREVFGVWAQWLKGIKN